MDAMLTNNSLRRRRKFRLQRRLTNNGLPYKFTLNVRIISRGKKNIFKPRNQAHSVS